MNLKRTAAMVVLIASFVGTLHAAPGMVFYLHTGTTIPMAPALFKDTYTQGFDVGAVVGLRYSKRFEIQGALAYNNCAFDYQGYRGTLTEVQEWKVKGGTDQDPDVSIDGNAANIWSLFANAKWIFPTREGGRVESYVVLGGGLFGLRKGKISAVDYEAENRPVFPGHAKNTPATNETVLAGQLCLGLDVLLEEHSNFYVEIGAMLGLTKTDPTVVFPIKFGVSIRP
jgi:hypothetical protein